MLEITAEPIELEALVRAVRTDACGAVVAFAGVVRETSPDDPRPVRSIRYEAYAALALTQLREIAAATRGAFGPLEIAIVHRIGELTLGETSIAIAVAAPHRGRAFDGCEYAIDEIKARLAVWKQEVFADGEREWRANAPPLGAGGKPLGAGGKPLGEAAPST
jgi:molybdopterin synthase catalytic subunit